MAEEKKETNQQLVLKGVRLSYPHLFSPKYNKDDQTGRESYAYEATFLIPKRLEDGTKNPAVATIQKAIKDAIAARWPGGDKSIPTERRCFVDGEPIDPDTRDEDGNGGVRKPLSPESAGMMVLRTRARVDGVDAPNPVQLLGPRKTAKNDKGEPCFPKLKQSEGLLYGGCYVDAVVSIYGFDGTKYKVPDRVNCGLDVVKFKAHGESFGRQAADANSLLDEEDEDETPSGGKAGSSIDDDDDIG